MPRKPRYDYPGATHHVFNRGAGREAIFLDDDDRRDFLLGLEIISDRYRVRVLSYALMTNHWHAGLSVPLGNLSAAMQHLFGRYVRRFNDRHASDGGLFRGRFANRLVETEDYLRNLFAYIHLNPVRAGIAPDAASAPWTSHAAALGLAPRPRWLDCSWVETVYGGRDAFRAFVDAYDPEFEPGGEPCPPPVTEVEATPGQPLVMASPVAQTLGLAAWITDTPRQRIRSAKGRPGEFVAWALAALSGLEQPEIAAILRITKAAVGQRIRRFQAWSSADPVGRAWLQAALAPGKVVGL